jgi:hypothetical protein
MGLSFFVQGTKFFGRAKNKEAVVGKNRQSESRASVCFSFQSPHDFFSLSFVPRSRPRKDTHTLSHKSHTPRAHRPKPRPGRGQFSHMALVVKRAAASGGDPDEASLATRPRSLAAAKAAVAASFGVEEAVSFCENGPTRAPRDSHDLSGAVVPRRARPASDAAQTCSTHTLSDPVPTRLTKLALLTRNSTSSTCAAARESTTTPRWPLSPPAPCCGWWRRAVGAWTAWPR